MPSHNKRISRLICLPSKAASRPFYLLLGLFIGSIPVVAASLHRNLPGDASRPAIKIVRNVAYGSDPMQKLDVYFPAGAKNAPVILMVHGGGWRRGDKSASGVVTNKVTRWVHEGYIFISVNYRLIPRVNPVEEARDVATALAFAQKHSAEWGADPTRFILIGHSAGAHLVCLLSANPTIAAEQGARPWRGTVCLDSAAYNVVEIMDRPHFRLYDQAFGKDRGFWRKASPTLALKKPPVPMLLVYSTLRRDSGPQAKAFAEKANSLGGHVSTLPVDMKHGPIDSELGLPGAYTEKVNAFIQSLVMK